MSAAGTRLSSGLASALPKGRSPLAHLLHALNQPLTGLQCSLELALAGPHSTKHYVGALREGLELTCRMRVLVEAIRELADAQPSNPEKVATILLDRLLLTTADELEPVAKENGVRLKVATGGPLAVRADRDRLEAVLFRCLESGLSLSAKKTDFQVSAEEDQSSASITLCWTEDTVPEYSPFSRQELGLLIAQAAWEQSGGEWTGVRAENRKTCILRFPLVADRQTSSAVGGPQ